MSWEIFSDNDMENILVWFSHEPFPRHVKDIPDNLYQYSAH